MRLFLADYHLEASRFALLLEQTVHEKTAQQHLTCAIKLIDEMGYKRRLAEVAYLQQWLAGTYYKKLEVALLIFKLTTIFREFFVNQRLDVMEFLLIRMINIRFFCFLFVMIDWRWLFWGIRHRIFELFL